MDGPRDCHTEWNKSDREREMSYDIPYMWNLKRNDTKKLTYKTKETHRLREWNYGCPWLKAGGTDSWGVWDGYVQAARFKMDNQERRPTVQHMNLCSVLYGSPDGRGFVCLFVCLFLRGWKMDTCIYMAESLHCLSETITTVLIGHIPIQNKKLKD